MKKLIQIRQTNEEGFTLIEVMMVLIIIGILLAIATPVFLASQLREAASTVTKDVKTNVSFVESYFTKYPYALIDSKTAGCNTGLKTTPELQVLTQSNAECISIVGNRDNFRVTGSISGIDGKITYVSTTGKYETEGANY